MKFSLTGRRISLHREQRFVEAARLFQLESFLHLFDLFFRVVRLFLCLV